MLNFNCPNKLNTWEAYLYIFREAFSLECRINHSYYSFFLSRVTLFFFIFHICCFHFLKNIYLKSMLKSRNHYHSRKFAWWINEEGNCGASKVGLQGWSPNLKCFNLGAKTSNTQHFLTCTNKIFKFQKCSLFRKWKFKMKNNIFQKSRARRDYCVSKIKI